MTFKTYLTTLIEEKGTDLHDEIGLDGHIGLTWAMLVDFKTMLVKIDFLNGDVFHYLRHLAEGMVAALGY
jgi:hypothetical protein